MLGELRPAVVAVIASGCAGGGGSASTAGPLIADSTIEPARAGCLPQAEPAPLAAEDDAGSRARERQHGLAGVREGTAADSPAVRVERVEAEVDVVRELQDDRVTRRGEVEHGRDVQEVREEPVRAQSPADRDRATADDEVADGASRHELHPRGLGEAHAHVAEEEVGWDLRADRNRMEAGPRGSGVLAGDLALTRYW